MKVQTAEQENPDGSLNLFIEEMTKEEAEFFIGKGLVSTLQEEVDRIKLQNSASKSWMATITQIAIHRAGTSPMQSKEGYLIEIDDEGMIYLKPKTPGELFESVVFTDETLRLIDDEIKRMKEQTGMQNAFNKKGKV